MNEKKLQSACADKHPHKSKGAAEAHIRGMIRSNKPGADRLEPYKCPFCEDWHVGKKKLP